MSTLLPLPLPLSRLPRVGLGCARIGSFNNPAGARQTRRLIDLALDLGVDLLDTADIYGQGDSERQIGRALRGRPDAALVVTKVGHAFPRAMAALRPLKPLLKPLISSIGAGRSAMTALRAASVSAVPPLAAAGIAAAAEASLRRLGTGRLDALLLHDASAASVRDPAVAEAMERLVARGLVRSCGASCLDVEALAAAAAAPWVAAVQTTAATLEAVGADARLAFGRRGVALLLREAVASRPDLPPAEAVRRACRRHPDACVVVGTTSPGHLEEVVAAVGGGRASCPLPPIAASGALASSALALAT